MITISIASAVLAIIACLIVGKMILAQNRERQDLSNSLTFLHIKIESIMSVTDDIKADVATLGGVLGNLLTAAQSAAAQLAAGAAGDGVSAADAASIKASLDAEILQAQQALAALTPAPVVAAPVTEAAAQ